MIRALTEVILPVVLVAGLGFGLSRKFVFDPGTLSRLQLFALVPALTFSATMKTSVPMEHIVGLGVAFVVTSVVIGVLAWIAGRWLPEVHRRSVIACAVIGNNGNFGLPIALLALGQAGLDQAVVIFLFSNVVMWTAGPALLGSRSTVRGMLSAIVRLPVLWAMVAAIVVRMTGVVIPVGINAAIELVGQAVIPMVLISLGIQLGANKGIRFSPAVLVATGLRILVLPLVAWLVGRLLGLTGVPLQSLVLACAMPTAVNVAMLSVEYQEDVETCASEVALSTLLSIPILAVVITLLPLFG